MKQGMLYFIERNVPRWVWEKSFLLSSFLLYLFCSSCLCSCSVAKAWVWWHMVVCFTLLFLPELTRTESWKYEKPRWEKSSLVMAKCCWVKMRCSSKFNFWCVKNHKVRVSESWCFLISCFVAQVFLGEI